MKVFLHTHTGHIIVIHHDTALLELAAPFHTHQQQIHHAHQRLESDNYGLFVFNQNLTDLMNPEPPNPSQKPESEQPENPDNPQPHTL